MKLRSVDLVVIAPHLKRFQLTQTMAVAPYLESVDVIVPQPRFPSALLTKQWIADKLEFLVNARSSCIKGLENKNIWIHCPQFFTLPIEVLRKKQPIFFQRAVIKVLKTLSHVPGLVHAHRLDFALAGITIKKLHGTPLIVTCHGSDVYDFPFHDEFRYRIVKVVLGNADRIIAVSNSDAEGIVSLGYPRRNISVIPNGFNPSVFKVRNSVYAREILGVPRFRKIILAVGSLFPVKGHSTLIKSMRIISRIRKDVMAIIIGSGPLETSLRLAIRDYGLQENVKLVGRVKPREVATWMSACDVVALPSLNEGFPTVIPESLACGKPVVATNVGGIPDAITKDIGMLVHPENPYELADALLAALEAHWDSSFLEECATQYSVETIKERILSIYDEVIGDWFDKQEV